MPLLVYRPRLFDNTAENLQFRCLCEELKKRISIADRHNKPELCLFVGNFNFAEKEFDAFMIKRNAIILIEFKNFGGKISISNNEWKVVSEGQPGIIKGGSGGKTPLEQARLNRNAFIRNMVDSMTLTQSQAQKISSLVVFNHNAEIENNLRLNIQTWLNVCDNRSFFGTIESIVNKDFDFSALEMKRIAERLVLDDDYIIEEYSNTEFLDTWNTPHLLEKYNQLLNGEIIFSPEPDPFEEIKLFEDIKKYKVHTEEKKQDKKPNKEETELSLKSFIIENEDSIALSNFVKRIVKLSLKLDDVTIMVLDGVKASSYFAAYGIKLTREYVVTISANGIGEHCTKLTRLTNHDVKSVSSSTIFWEEGEKLSIEDNSSFYTVKKCQSKDITNTNSNVSFRKSKTILPHWIDKKIFKEYQAIYAPEHARYEYNLNLNEEELKVYLGTYFPRSYAEMFCIIDNLMHNTYLKEMLQQDEISVLDCGCGTGGEILGFITAIGKHLPHAKINITAIDGNDGALAILKNLIESNPNKKIQIELNTVTQTLNKSEDVIKLASGKNNYHFVLCDKMVCELISKEVLSANAYAIMAKMLTTYLHKNGLMIMLDITTKDKHSGYFYPQLMNSAINEYVRRNRNIETLLPLSCACYDGCKELCFMQQIFSVSHSHKSNDESRVCYRVLCKKQLKTAIMKGHEIANCVHIIHPIKYKQNDESAICNQSKQNETTIDSFNIIM